MHKWSFPCLASQLWHGAHHQEGLFKASGVVMYDVMSNQFECMSFLRNGIMSELTIFGA